MGLRGDIPSDLRIQTQYVVEADDERQIVDSAGPATMIMLKAYVEGSDDAIAWLDIRRPYDESEEWFIDDIGTDGQYQRRGIASQLMNEAHGIIAALGPNMQLDHNDLLTDDGLAWAMALDGNGYEPWEHYSEDRISERFDGGLLSKEHDRHLQRMLRSNDPDEVARAHAYLDTIPLPSAPEVGVDLQKIRVAEDGWTDGTGPLILVREGGGMYGDDSEPYYVHVGGSLAQAVEEDGAYVTAKVVDRVSVETEIPWRLTNASSVLPARPSLAEFGSGSDQELPDADSLADRGL